MLEVTSDLPKQVRTTCVEVAERATSVRIEDEAIASFADALAGGTSEPLTLDPAHLDYMLWNRGRLPVCKSLLRHRCKTR
jgi:hypothetical protein